MERRSILKLLALAAIDPEVLIWTPGKKTIIDAPRYTFDQWWQYQKYLRHRGLWVECLATNERFWLEVQPDIYQRIAAGDRRAKELRLV